jgi:predicted Fe-S protein YdhL (DUF1289 family)
MDGKVLTPCIKVCKLVDNICIGCKRTIEEIKQAYKESKYNGNTKKEKIKK